MSFKCLLGMHVYGMPRTNGDGTLDHECMNCLHIERSSLLLAHEKGVAESFDVRRNRAIADLVTEDRWVGIPSNAAVTPEPAPLGRREVDGVSTRLYPRPQAA
jgi:hypothetical protein